MNILLADKTQIMQEPGSSRQKFLSHSFELNKIKQGQMKKIKSKKCFCKGPFKKKTANIYR